MYARVQLRLIISDLGMQQIGLGMGRIGGSRTANCDKQSVQDIKPVTLQGHTNVSDHHAETVCPIGVILFSEYRLGCWKMTQHVHAQFTGYTLHL